jgi:hypothetical protein
MLVQTATSPRYLTLVDLVSKKMTWDDVLNAPVRSSKSVELYSDRLLYTAEINSYIADRYPGYLVVGVYELEYGVEAEEF